MNIILVVESSTLSDLLESVLKERNIHCLSFSPDYRPLIEQEEIERHAAVVAVVIENINWGPEVNRKVYDDLMQHDIEHVIWAIPDDSETNPFPGSQKMGNIQFFNASVQSFTKLVSLVRG